MGRKLSLETSLIVQYLVRCYHARNVARFSEMDKIIGRSIKHQRHLLNSALRYVQREYNMIFKNLQGIGYDPVKKNIATYIRRSQEKKIQSAVKLWNEKLNTVDFTTSSFKELNEYAHSQIKQSIFYQVLSEEIDQKIKKASEVSAIKPEQIVNETLLNLRKNR